MSAIWDRTNPISLVRLALDQIINKHCSVNESSMMILLVSPVIHGKLIVDFQ